MVAQMARDAKTISTPYLTAYDRFRLLNDGLIPGTQEWNIAAFGRKGTDEEKKAVSNYEKGKSYKKVGLAGAPLTRSSQLAEVLATLPEYNQMARAIAASISPRPLIGGSR